jgi:RNase P protein component
MREVLRLIKQQWPEQMDLLFILKKEVLTADFQELLASVQHSFEKIPEALLQPPKPKMPKARKKTSVVFRESSSV